jgi:hypothetical protein
MVLKSEEQKSLYDAFSQAGEDADGGLPSRRSSARESYSR